MKKLLVVLSAMMLFSSAATATAIACNHGAGGSNEGHPSRLVALLLPPATGPTGSTGATGPTGATGTTASVASKHFKGTSNTTTGPRGIAFVKQSTSKLKLDVGLKGLTAGAVYTVGLVQDVDGAGCASTTNPVLDPPGPGTATANAAGYAHSKLKVLTSVFALDLTKPYYVKVTDSTGATVVCGNLVASSHHGHGWGSFGGEHGHGHH